MLFNDAIGQEPDSASLGDALTVLSELENPCGGPAGNTSGAGSEALAGTDEVTVEVVQTGDGAGGSISAGGATVSISGEGDEVTVAVLTGELVGAVDSSLSGAVVVV